MPVPAQPRRRAQLCTSTVHDRFVVLDPVARTLVELHADLRSLWPLLDGSQTVPEIARRWPATAELDAAGGRRTVDAVLDELSAASLLESHED